MARRQSIQKRADDKGRRRSHPRLQPVLSAQRTKEAENAAFMTWKFRECYRRDTKFFKRWLPRSAGEKDDVLKRKEELYLRRELDCSLHCDSPSECRHAVRAAEKREALREAEEAGSSYDDVSFIELNGRRISMFSRIVSPADCRMAAIDGSEEDDDDDDEKEEQKEENHDKEEEAVPTSDEVSYVVFEGHRPTDLGGSDDDDQGEKIGPLSDELPSVDEAKHDFEIFCDPVPPGRNHGYGQQEEQELLGLPEDRRRASISRRK